MCSPANEVPSCGGNFSFPLLPQVAAQSIPRRGVQRKLRLGSSFTVSLSAAAFAGEAIPLHAIRHMFNVHIHSSRVTSQPSLGLTKKAEVLQIQLWVIFVVPPQIHWQVLASVLQRGPQSWTTCVAENSFQGYAGRGVTSTVVPYTHLFMQPWLRLAVHRKNFWPRLCDLKRIILAFK